MLFFTVPAFGLRLFETERLLVICVSSLATEQKPTGLRQVCDEMRVAASVGQVLRAVRHGYERLLVPVASMVDGISLALSSPLAMTYTSVWPQGNASQAHAHEIAAGSGA